MSRISAAVLFCVLLSGNAYGQSLPKDGNPGTPEREKVVRSLVYGTTEKATDMDPASAYDFHTWEIFQNISTGLLAYKPGTTELVPALAESYTVNAKGDEYTFKLRGGVQFTDGSALDAAAVKWTIDRVIALKGDPSWLVSDFVKSVDVVDAKTVRFVLKQPVAYFPALVATPPYFPLPSRVYPKDRIIRNPDELTGKALVGLGAYRATSFKRDEEVVLEANPSFFGGEPGVEKIIIRYFTDAAAMRLALEKGEIDLAYGSMNPSDIKDLSANAALVANRLPGPYIRSLCYECSQGAFKNKKLRQAVGLLLNRVEIAEKVLQNQDSPLYSMVPAGMIYHKDDFKTAGEGNVAAAEKLLKEAGYSSAKPFAFDLWYTPTHYGDKEGNLVEVMKSQLEKSKLVKVTVKSAEWAAYTEQRKNGQMPAFLLGWYPDYNDPDNYTAAFAGSAGSRGMGINFSSKEWDDLFTKEQGNADPAVRRQVFERIQKMWTDEMPTVPILQGDLYVFTRKSVAGVKIGPALVFNYDQLQFTDKDLTARLITASQGGNDGEIAALIKAGASIHVQTESGMTPLTLAAMYNGNAKAIYAFIMAGADSNERTASGMTPLMLAAKHNPNPDVLSMLLSAGADHKARDLGGWTPLMYAAMHARNPETVSVLLKAGADLKAKEKEGWTPFLIAAESNANPDVITAFLHAGVDVNAKNGHGRTPLQSAAGFNANPDVISVLLGAGADVNAKDENGSTALMYAIRYNANPLAVSILLDAGADINMKEKDGWTPLMYALKYNAKFELIARLLKSGADIKAREKDGWTPLLLAARHAANPEVISMLLKAGADVEGKNESGWTPLLTAARYNTNREVVSVLLRAGADGSWKSSEGKTAFDYAQENASLKGTKQYWQLNDASYR